MSRAPQGRLAEAEGQCPLPSFRWLYGARSARIPPDRAFLSLGPSRSLEPNATVVNRRLNTKAQTAGVGVPPNPWSFAGGL